MREIQNDLERKQGRTHDSISRVRVGRGSDGVEIAFGLKFQQRDGRTNQPTDGPTDLQSDLQSCVYATKNSQILSQPLTIAKTILAKQEFTQITHFLFQTPAPRLSSGEPRPFWKTNVIVTSRGSGQFLKEDIKKN